MHVFMRKALLIVAMLLLATPVMATTTITAVQGTQFTASDGNLVQPVSITYSSDVDVRAFALDINVDSNNGSPNFQGIRGFKTGESNGASVGGSSGYGIFPSRFRNFIVVTSPNWADPNYNPTTAWNEPGTTSLTWGMGFPQMIVEMGTLYLGDANKPATSGTLFTFDVNNWGVYGTFHLTIAADALRGGVVNTDGNSITATYVGTDITFALPCNTILNEVGVDKATAEAAWSGPGQGFTPSGTAGSYSDTIPANQVVTQDTGCFQPPHTVNYTYSKGRFPTPSEIIYPKWDSDCCVPIYWSPVAGATAYQLERSSNSGSTFTSTIYTGTATYKGDAVTAGPNYRYRVLARNADSNSLYMTGTYDCNAYLSTCYKGGVTSDPNWAQWLLVGRPDCWCKASTAQEPNGSGYQCDGDADGTINANGYRVYSADLSMLSNNYKKLASQLTMDPNVTLMGKLKIHSACADFDHKANANGYRIYSADLAILSANYKKLNSSSVTATNKLPGNCPR